jgi:hypothetical protein
VKRMPEENVEEYPKGKCPFESHVRDGWTVLNMI